MKSLITLVTIFIFSSSLFGQNNEIYIAKRPYEIYGFGNKRYIKSDLRNAAKDVKKIYTRINGESVAIAIENGTFVIFPNGRKKGKYSTNEISVSVSNTNVNFSSDYGYYVNYKIIISNNLFQIYKNDNPKAYVSDSLDFEDTNNEKYVLFISRIKNETAILNEENNLKNSFLSNLDLLLLDKNKWYTINVGDRIGALEPRQFMIDENKITVRAYAYKFSELNFSDFNYKNASFSLDIPSDGQMRYCQTATYATKVYTIQNNEGFIDFFLVPSCKIDSIRVNRGENKFAKASININGHKVFIGDFEATPSNYNSGPQIDDNEFILSLFVKKIMANKNNEKEVLLIINNPRFDITKFENAVLYSFKEVPALKAAAELQINTRIEKGTGSIPYEGWMFTGPIKNGLPNGQGVLKNPSPSGYAVSQVEIEYKGTWNKGKKNGAFNVLSMYYSSMGGGTIYTNKTKYFKDDIEYEPETTSNQTYSYNPSQKKDDYEIKKTYNNNGLYDRTKTEDVTLKCKKTGNTIIFSRYYLDKDDPNTWHIGGVGFGSSSYDTYEKALKAAIEKLNCH